MIKVFVADNPSRLTVEVVIVNDVVDGQFGTRYALCFEGGQPKWEEYARGTTAPVAYVFDYDYAHLIYDALKTYYKEVDEIPKLLREDYLSERTRVDKLLEYLIRPIDDPLPFKDVQ